MSKRANFDDIKEFWKKQKTPQNYSQGELLKMLNKKSSNNVKYIVILSIIEFIILILSLFITATDKDLIEVLNTHTKEVYIKNYRISQVLLYINIIISISFIYYFYRYYKRINIVQPVRQLIRSILVFRRSVNIFIVINIILGFLYLFLTGFYDLIFNIRKSIELKSANVIDIENLHTPFYSTQYFILFTIIFVLILVIIILYYLFTYGIFMRKLKNDLEELKKYEETQNV